MSILKLHLFARKDSSQNIGFKTHNIQRERKPGSLIQICLNSEVALLKTVYWGKHYQKRTLVSEGDNYFRMQDTLQRSITEIKKYTRILLKRGSQMVIFYNVASHSYRILLNQVKNYFEVIYFRLKSNICSSQGLQINRSLISPRHCPLWEIKQMKNKIYFGMHTNFPLFFKLYNYR